MTITEQVAGLRQTARWMREASSGNFDLSNQFTEAADTIERQAAEIERLRALLAAALLNMHPAVYHDDRTRFCCMYCKAKGARPLTHEASCFFVQVCRAVAEPLPHGDTVEGEA